MSRQMDIKALVSHIVRGDGGDRCRICMGDTSEGQVYLGDTVMLDGDRPVTLSELLEVVAGVEMSDDAPCSLGVCLTCTNAAVAAQEFKIFVRNSDKAWSDAIECLSDLPETCPEHVKSITIFVKSNFTAQIVNNYNNADPKTVLDRLKNKPIKKKKNGSDRKPRTARAGPSCNCDDCGKYFSTPYYLSMHLRNSGQKEVCLVCGVTVIRGQAMKNHMLEMHKRKLILCPDCPLLFSSEAELRRHKKRAHKAGALTCGDCGRTFPRAASFEVHSQMHAVRTCRLCGKQFANRSCYREHRSQCEPGAKPDLQTLPKSRRSNIRDPATFICDYCRKVYHSRPQLKNHIIWIHMDIRPHQCQWCGKRFYTPARLAEHTVVHTRERNYECDICGAKLVSKMAAVYHRRRHTGEKPYECEDCGEKFICASRRSEHAKRRHNKGMKMQCSQCPANFVRGHELRKHVEKAHSQKKLIYVPVES